MMGQPRRHPIQRLFDWRVRGFRWVEIAAAAVLAATVFFVYVAKTGAAEEAERIAELEGDIRTTGQRVRLLRAEVAKLEQPQRLETLSEAAGLAPIASGRRAEEDDLAELGGVPAPAPPPSAGPPPLAAVATVPPSPVRAEDAQ